MSEPDASKPAPAGAPPIAGDDDAIPIARRVARHTDALRGEIRDLLWGGRVRRMPMVHWFDPVQLVSTGLMTIASLVVGQRSDRRIVQALSARRRALYDYTCHYREGDRGPEPDRTRPRDEIWIDYVCDTGDGWNSTYAVAYAAAQPRLEVRVPGEEGAHDTRRGDLLVFGGDEVYPTPSREEYRRRLIGPYGDAIGEDRPEEPPHVFAIPGNHDWYDGLSAFSRLFCSDTGGRRFAGWRTRQSRSYFALKLPGGWWLLGSDGQLESDIDIPQIEYFKEIADQQMRPGDRAILCLSTPSWIYAHKYRQLGEAYDETDLLYLREEVFARRGVEVRVFLSGDLHHYRRHEEKEPRHPDGPVQKITAGGGGAFLHPTHDEDVREIVEDASAVGGEDRTFALRAAWPSPRVSRRLAWRNLLFGFRNPSFGIVPAILYLMTTWIVGASIGYQKPTGALEALTMTGRAFARNPAITLWVALVVAVFVLFTDTRSRLYRWLGGLTHALVHWFGMFYVGWGALVLAYQALPGSPITRFLLGSALAAAAGWAVGSAIMGLYLLVSLNVFGRHSEEAFSALRIEDYKHFLRLHVRADGGLTIYPVGIERVPRGWRERREGEASPSRVQPDGPLEPVLLESPIVLPGRPPRP